MRLGYWFYPLKKKKKCHIISYMGLKLNSEIKRKVDLKNFFTSSFILPAI